MAPGIFFEAVAGSYAAGVVTFTAPLKARHRDVLFAFLAIKNTASVVTAPTGWSLYWSEAAGATAKLAVYRREVEEEEPSSYAFSIAAAAETLGAVVLWRGVSASAAVVAASKSTSLASPTQSIPTRTITDIVDLRVGIAFTATLSNITLPGSLTQHLQYDGAAATFAIGSSNDDGLGVVPPENAGVVPNSDGVGASMIIRGLAATPTVTFTLPRDGTIGLLLG